jgi:hypothetical protein
MDDGQVEVAELKFVWRMSWQERQGQACTEQVQALARTSGGYRRVSSESQGMQSMGDEGHHSEDIWRLWHHEEALQGGTDEEHTGDGAIGREGHEWEEDDAEPPMIWE